MEIFQNQDTSIQNEAIIPDSEIAKFKKIRWIYGIVLITSSILLFFFWIFFWLLPTGDYLTNHSFFLLFFIFGIFISGIVIIFSFLFLRNENNLEITKFLSLGASRRMAPGVKYGLMLFGLFTLTPTFLFKIEDTNDLIMHYSGVIVALISFYFFINGVYHQLIRMNGSFIYKVSNSKIILTILIFGFLFVYILSFRFIIYMPVLKYQQRDVFPHYSGGCEFC